MKIVGTNLKRVINENILLNEFLKLDWKTSLLINFFANDDIIEWKKEGIRNVRTYIFKINTRFFLKKKNNFCALKFFKRNLKFVE